MSGLKKLANEFLSLCRKPCIILTVIGSKNFYQQIQKTFRALLGIILCFSLSLSSPTHISAAVESCSSGTSIVYSDPPPDEISGGGTANFSISGLASSQTYDVVLDKHFSNTTIPITSISNSTSAEISLGPPATNTSGTYDIVVRNTSPSAIVKECKLGDIKITNTNSCSITVDQAGFENTQCVDATSGNITVHVTNIIVNQKPANNETIKVTFQGGVGLTDPTNSFGPNYTDTANGGSIPPREFEVGENAVGSTFQVSALLAAQIFPPRLDTELCSTSFKIIDICNDEDRTQPTSDTNFSLCEQIPGDSEAFGRCARCIAGQDVEGSGIPAAPDVPEGIWTAVGCIKNDPQSIVTVVIKVGMGVAGGVALLMILAASFTLSTSQGDAKKTAEGKEMVSSAVIGLIFIIMAITMLEFIGVKIFRIPGFGE